MSAGISCAGYHLSLQTLAPLGTSDISFTLIDFSLPEVID